MNSLLKIQKKKKYKIKKYRYSIYICIYSSRHLTIDNHEYIYPGFVKS